MDKQELKLREYWWCPKCQEELPPSHVTFEETHDIDACQRPVVWESNKHEVEIDALTAKITQLSRMVNESETAENEFRKNVERLEAENEQLRESVEFLRGQLSAPQSQEPF